MKQKKEPAKADKKVREKKPKKVTMLDRLKMEIAEELGLGDKVRTEGWGGLSASETGRIGGILSRRVRQEGLDLKALDQVVVGLE